MFLFEHTHSDFEIRFFVDGCGTFYIHHSDKVYAIICEKGDLISIPAETTHWFDMGTKPFFKAIRFFTIPDGWVGKFTGSDISKRIPTHDELIEGKFERKEEKSQKEENQEEYKAIPELKPKKKMKPEKKAKKKVNKKRKKLVAKKQKVKGKEKKKIKSKQTKKSKKQTIKAKKSKSRRK